MDHFKRLQTQILISEGLAMYNIIINLCILSATMVHSADALWVYGIESEHLMQSCPV